MQSETLGRPCLGKPLRPLTPLDAGPQLPKRSCLCLHVRLAGVQLSLDIEAAKAVVLHFTQVAQPASTDPFNFMETVIYDQTPLAEYLKGQYLILFKPVSPALVS